MLCEIQQLLWRFAEDQQQMRSDWRRSRERAEPAREFAGDSAATSPRNDVFQGATPVSACHDDSQDFSTDDWGFVERKGLFVIGSARSGTTIFAGCLNLSRQVYLLQESDLFVRQAEPDFVTFFNNRHREYGNLEQKGAYIPPALFDERGACPLLHRISRDHSYVGEKLAIGARPHALPDDWHAQCFEFYARNFYRATYFMTVRRPSEVAWSMRKKWPTYDASSFLECWLLVLDFIVDLYLSFERAHLSFFDRFSPVTIARAADILKIDLEIPDETISNTWITSALAGAATPNFLMPYDSVCQACETLYRRLRESFSAETFRYCGAANGLRFFRGLKKSASGLLDDLRSLPARHS